MKDSLRVIDGIGQDRAIFMSTDTIRSCTGQPLLKAHDYLPNPLSLDWFAYNFSYHSACFNGSAF